MLEKYSSMLPDTFCVMGCDPGRDNIGAVKIMRERGSAVYILECAIRGVHSFLGRHKSTTALANFMNTLPKPLLVVCEDYTMQKYSMVSFSMGEMGGLVRLKIFYSCIPFLLNPPNLMRYFCGILPRTKSRPGKEMISSFARECGFVSTHRHALDRENCTDAFIHALMGVLWLGVEIGEDVDLCGYEYSAIQKLVYAKESRYIIPEFLSGVQINVSNGAVAIPG